MTEGNDPSRVVERLVKALDPFAAWGSLFYSGYYGAMADDEPIYATIRSDSGAKVVITAGDLRRAVSALEYCSEAKWRRGSREANALSQMLADFGGFRTYAGDKPPSILAAEAALSRDSDASLAEDPKGLSGEAETPPTHPPHQGKQRSAVIPSMTADQKGS